jgi:hypothetical protein
MIFLTILLALAAYVTWPGGSSLDYSSCEPKGVLSQLSATIYGRFFWEQQLSHVRHLATDIKSLDASWAKMSDAGQKPNQDLEDLYAKYPNMAPSASERAAERLRRSADRIEAQAALDQIFSFDKQALADARRCEQAIIEKLRTM